MIEDPLSGGASVSGLQETLLAAADVDAEGKACVHHTTGVNPILARKRPRRSLTVMDVSMGPSSLPQGSAGGSSDLISAEQDTPPEVRLGSFVSQQTVLCWRENPGEKPVFQTVTTRAGNNRILEMLKQIEAVNAPDCKTQPVSASNWWRAMEPTQ